MRIEKQAFDDFDEFAKDYRGIHSATLKFSGADSDYFSEQKVTEVKKNETKESPKVLDLGCGDGNSAIFFQKHFSDCMYTGLDTSKDSIGIARSKQIKGSDFSHFDGFNIPFPDKYFDIVFIACVLHHVDFGFHETLLKEVRRVLDFGGRLYIFEHNPINPLTRRVVNNCPFDKDAVLLHSSYTRKILQKLSFHKIDVAYTIFFPRHKVFRKVLRLERFLKWLPLGGQYYARAVKSS